MTGEQPGHPRHRLDPILNPPVRLSIMAALSGVQDIEFAALRDSVEVTDSVLSKQLSVLETVGYVRLEKGYFGKRPRTWARCTSAGGAAMEKHVEALQVVLGQ